MPDENASAEKDLLKIIENPDQAKAGQADAKAMSAGAPGRSKGMFSGLLASGKSFDPKTLFQLSVINRVLIVAAVAVFCNFLLTFFIESSRPGKADRFIESITREVGTLPEADEGMEEMIDQSLLVETEPVMARNLFGMKPLETPEDEKRPVYIDILNNYRLVGISLEMDPADSYAMIENTGSQVTYFLKQGDEFGGMKIVEIEPDKILVDIEGNVTELR